jgi:hypothetical protein
MTPDLQYDPARQRALFKLWLLLTTNEITVNESTQICKTTAEADQFRLSQVGNPGTVYYVDLEKLQPGLAPLQNWEIQQVFSLLQVDSAQQSLQSVSHKFWLQGTTLLGYGRIGCATVDAVVSIPGA